MERASRTLQLIMVKALAQVPAEQRPAIAWEFSVGAAVAEKTRVVACEKNTLFVEVPDATWRAQLLAMAPQFIARLRQFAPIERIQYQLARPQDAKRGNNQ
jgi:predicted nucleic acid-binding Zn ribbon protein